MLADSLPDVRSAVTVRPMSRGDLCFAASLHRQCLAHGFFPALGPRFLRSYLKTYTSGHLAVAFVAQLDGAAVGFLVGALDGPAHLRGVVRRHGLELATRGVIALALRPRLAWRFVRTRGRRYVAGVGHLARRSRRGTPVVVIPSTGAVLNHLAVVPAARGEQVGTALVDAFLEWARRQGVADARLNTRSGDAGAGGFYERLSWRPAATFVDRDGLAWTRYRIDLG